jgi:hypothetical protein
LNRRLVENQEKSPDQTAAEEIPKGVTSSRVKVKTTEKIISVLHYFNTKTPNFLSVYVENTVINAL